MSIDIKVYDKDSSSQLGSLENGKWRLTFEKSSNKIFDVAPFSQGQVSINGKKKITVYDVSQPDTNTYIVTVLVQDATADEISYAQSQESGISWGLVLFGAFVIGGLLLSDMALTKVERIIDTPAGQVAFVGGSILVVVLILVGAWFLWKRYGK